MNVNESPTKRKRSSVLQLSKSELTKKQGYNQTTKMNAQQLTNKRKSDQTANMPAIRLQGKHSSDQTANMPDDRVLTRQAANQAGNMSSDRLQGKHASDQTANMPDDRVLTRQAANQTANMSSDRLQGKHASDQVATMPADRREAQRFRHTYANMTPAQIEKERLRSRKKVLLFTSLECEWDFDHPCQYCGHVWLTTSSPGTKKLCCQDGTLTFERGYPLAMKSLSENMSNLMQHSEDFSRASNQYNNILSLGSVGVDNGRQGGYDHIRGPHSVRLSGRTYHMMHNTNKNTGLQYFLHDGQDIKLSNDKRHKNVEQDLLEAIVADLLETNKMCQEFKFFGKELKSFVNDPENDIAYLEANIDDFVVNLNDRAGTFEIAAITMDHFGGEHILKVIPKNSPDTGTKNDMNTVTKISSTDKRFEPLAYPILFTHGEDGWYKDCGVQFRKYLASRMLQPDLLFDDTYHKYLGYPTRDKKHYMPTSRFKKCSRVGQTYLVDMLSRSIDFQLEFQQKNKNLIFGRNKTPKDSGDDDKSDDNYTDSDSDEDNDGAAGGNIRIQGEERKGDDDLEDGDSKGNDDERDDSKANDGISKFSKPCFLSQSLHGGKRHLKKCAMQALEMVQAYGRVHGFLTVTCNKEWRELSNVIPLGDDAFDHPALVNLIFKEKLHRLLTNLRNGKYFGGKKTCFIVNVIEYQERGLPHAHIVFRLEGLDDEIVQKFEETNQKRRTDNDLHGRVPGNLDYLKEVSMDDTWGEWIDEWFLATIPEVKGFNEYDSSKDYEDAVRFRELIKGTMLHKCTDHKPNGCKYESATCKKFFDMNTITDIGYFNARKFYMYKRKDLEDLKVVVHVKDIVMDWNGHACCLFSGDTYQMLYLYKYLFKGPDKVKAQLLEEKTLFKDLHKADEIGRYIRGRKICAMDAQWRIYGFHTYPKSTPPVTTVKIRTEEFVITYREKKMLVDIDVYFNRPLQLRHLTFLQFFQTYIIKRFTTIKPNSTIDSSTDMDTHQYIHLPFFDGKLKRNVKVHLSLRHKRSVCRIETVSYQAGELWYLRLLLKANTPTSFQDAKVYKNPDNNTEFQCTTYQDCCLRYEIVKDKNECALIFMETILSEPPSVLRSLFVVMTVNLFPTWIIWNDERNLTAMQRDFLEVNLYCGDECERKSFQNLLSDLAYKFEKYGQGQCLSLYGFPEPEQRQTLLERERVKYVLEKQRVAYEVMEQARPSSAAQLHLINTIYNVIINMKATSPARYFYFEGDAGTGKTETLKKLICKIRGTAKPNDGTGQESKEAPVIQAYIVKGCCSTALAATNFPNDFTTAHSLFNFPVDDSNDRNIDDPPLQCKLSENPEKKALLESTDVIVFDEFINLDKMIFESAYEELNEFKGKVIIATGNKKQMLPVIQNAFRNVIIESTVLRSFLWERFTMFTLEENFRLLNLQRTNATEHEQQLRYKNVLDAIGTNTENADAHYYSLIDDHLGNKDEHIYELPTIEYILETNTQDETEKQLSINKVLHKLYPNGYDAIRAKDNVVLCSVNKVVDEWNEIIGNINPGKEHTLISDDWFADVDDTNGFLKNMLSDEVLNRYKRNGVPDHTLKLRVDDIVILLRNLDIEEGLVNNLRIRIIEITNYRIKVQTLDAEKKIHFIPRILFGGSFDLMRRQFPFRRAFALTFNKSQGQTLETVILDLRRPLFSHGHLYVGMSRVTKYSNLLLYIDEECLSNIQGEIPCPITKNIVYQEVLKY